jgi:hypothetical protein
MNRLLAPVAITFALVAGTVAVVTVSPQQAFACSDAAPHRSTCKLCTARDCLRYQPIEMHRAGTAHWLFAIVTHAPRSHSGCFASNGTNGNAVDGRDSDPDDPRKGSGRDRRESAAGDLQTPFRH